MMNMLEEAVIYATVMHQGEIRKFGNRPYIMHPMEVAHILSTLTDDLEIITAGFLHDIVEDTDGTLREIAQSRDAFILGIPTVISFGIVSVGNRYGAMYELLDSETVSQGIARSPKQLRFYAKLMADLARTVHGIDAAGRKDFPDVRGRLRFYVEKGLGDQEKALCEKCLKLVDGIPAGSHMLHGDFHTGNVFLKNGEPLLIDMDRLAVGHPVAEISDLYYFYVILGEDDPSVVENFMGFSYETAKRFFRLFLEFYLGTAEEDRIREVTEKASVIGYARKIRKIRSAESRKESDAEEIAFCLGRLRELTDKYDTLAF